MSQLLDTPILPGLLWAMRFDESGKAHPIPPGEPIPDLGSFGEGFLWLHFNLVDARLDTVIAEGRLGPKDLASIALGTDEHQRVLVKGSFIGGVVADLCPETKSATPPGRLARLHFVIGPRFLVSGRRRPVASPDVTRDSIQEAPGITAPIQLFETMVSHVVASIAEGGTKLSDELDQIEDHVIDQTGRDELRRIGPIRRDSVRLHRQLLGLRAVFHRLEEDGGDAGLPDAEIVTAGRIAQRLDALDRDMVVLADRSRMLQEELSTRLFEASNYQLHTLSILTALFLPPTLITGVFGMNTKGLFLSDYENGSLMALCLCILSSLCVFLIIRMMGIAPSRK